MLRIALLALLFLGRLHCLHASGCGPGLTERNPGEALMRDLMIVKQINNCACDRMPVTYNHLLQGGYLNMPSALMADEGTLRVGFSSVPPYYNINVALQPFPNLEATLNYRIFRGVDDPILSPMGFGDMSDRGINLKFALTRPEDSDYWLPGVAIGADDFLGTKNFQALYIVGTQVWPLYNLEASVGYGGDRYHALFGGVIWQPFRRWCYSWLRPIVLVAEYDATNYRDPNFEKHPKGRNVSSRINFGLKYRAFNWIDMSVAQVRGEEFAWSLSTSWDLGVPYRLIPALDDPKPYCAPVNTEPLGCYRTELALTEELTYTLRDQGFEVWEIGVGTTECTDTELRIRVSTDRWMYSCDTYQRLREILVALIPDDFDIVTVIIEASRGFPVQEYCFRQEYLGAARAKGICRYELDLLTWEGEASACPCDYHLTFLRQYPLLNWFAAPKMRYLFGSSRGKFKYAVGLNVGTDGFLFDEIFYRFQLGYIAKSSIPPNIQQDTLNPSQLPNVQTDVLNYYQERNITIDEFLLQKNWNLGCGLYGRLSTGLFTQFYGGFAGEVLYYPLHSCWALGAEVAKLYKRNTKGVSFSKTIRKFDGTNVTYVDFDGMQYFLDGYYIWKEADIDFKVSVGRFLAGDKGARFEVARTYASGLRLYGWYTYTDGHDHINGELYFDKGIGFTMPIDIFLTHSSAETWGESISAWLRDVGFRSGTGEGLFQLIHDTRL
ncbi:MAG: YjbH domain-containing protein [Chlamydiales bacterium]|nr:YjbH domain-containing protein [Chlamydiales bacterium]